MATTDWKPIRSLDGLWLAGIYALKHKPSGRVMVCGSTNVYKRLWDDLKALEHGHHYNPAVQRDLDADGPDAFEWWLVQEVGVPALLKLLKAYHVEEMAKQGLTYNVKPAVPKRGRALKDETLAPDPQPLFPRPRETQKARETRVQKALLDGLPPMGKDGALRVDELLKRVEALRDTNWDVS